MSYQIQPANTFEFVADDNLELDEGEWADHENKDVPNIEYSDGREFADQTQQIAF